MPYSFSTEPQEPSAYLKMNLKMKTKTFRLVALFTAILTLSTFAAAQKCTEDGTIKRVTKASSGKYETVTFEMLIKKPDFGVTNAHPPFSEYGSEKRLRIKGTYFKSIVLRGINWTCTIAESFAAKTSNIQAVKSVEQFEGQVEYIIGYAKKGTYVGETVTKTKKGSILVLRFKK
jgi:hypothetical protein